MTTWYVDYDGGTDANASAGNGDSFATRRKTIDNCVAAAIAPGDTIRVMASPTPTSIGNATWSGDYLPARTGGNGATNATPIVYTNLNHTVVAGDTVIVDAVVGNTAANGVWKVGTVVGNTYELLNADGSPSVGNGTTTSNGASRKVTNCAVTLATACTANIAVCGNRGQKGNWTGADANNVPTVLTTDYKEGGECQQIAIAAGMTTGLSAYYATGTLDLSGYQQVSFWIKQTVGTLGAANSLSLKLCSDTAGATPVNTINIPYLGALNQWSPIVVDTGGALGASIQSIALYVNTDNGAQTFLIDNIIACKASSAADSLNLTSLISKDPGDHSFGDTYECYWGIQSINGTRVMLDGITNTVPGTSVQRGYTGATETVATYKRETTKTLMVASSAYIQQMRDSGTSGNLLYYSGGWNRTDMSTQTGETWFDGQNGLGMGIVDATSDKPFTSYDKLNFTRVQYGLFLGYDQFIGICQCCNTTAAPIYNVRSRTTATTLSAVACGGAITPGTGSVVTTIGRADSCQSNNGITLGTSSYVTTIKSASNCSMYGVSMGISSYVGDAQKLDGNAYGLAVASKCTVGNAVISNSVTYGIDSSNAVAYLWAVLGGSTTGSGARGVNVSLGAGTQGALRNFTINETNEVSGHAAYADARVFSEKHDGIANNTQIFCDGGLISQQATIVHGAAASAWKFSPTSTNRSQYYPLNLPIAQVAVAAAALVTITAWFRRSDTGLTGRLVCKGGQLAGVTSDVVASMVAAADTWEQLTLTFTPTEAGVIEIEAQFYGGSTYSGYVSDATFNQA